MYLDNGTFYCGSTPTYDCISLYDLGNPTSSYSCSNFDTIESKERAAPFKPEGLLIYPNPTLGKLTLILPSTSTDGYQLSLHDTFGRTVYQEATIPHATSVDINMTDYDNGVYYIELRAEGRRSIQKVLKQGLE